MTHRAFLLAAGFGTRLRPLTEHRPKPLVPVCGLPMLDYALAQCRQHGLSPVIVNAHWLPEQVVTWASAHDDVTVSVEEPDILGTGGGLVKVRELLAERFAVVNADVLNNVDLSALVEAVPPGGGVLALRPHPDAERYGYVASDATGTIAKMRDIAKAEPEGELVLDTHFTGVHAMDRQMLDLAQAGFSCIIRTAYKALVPQRRIRGFRHTGTWLDVGDPTAYLDANLAVLDGELPLPLDPFAHGRRLGDSWVGEGAVVEGTLRRSVVGPGAVVPAGAELVDSVVWDGRILEAGTWERAIHHDGGVTAA